MVEANSSIDQLGETPETAPAGCAHRDTPPVQNLRSHPANSGKKYGWLSRLRSYLVFDPLIWLYTLVLGLAALPKGVFDRGGRLLHWFSRAGVAQLAGQAGFQQVAIGRPSKWIDAAHAKSVLQHKAASSAINRMALQVARLIPDRVSIPYIADDLFWVLFRRVDGGG